MYKFNVQDPFFLPHTGCDVEIALKKGDFTILVGENGVGKTTLLSRFFEQSRSISCLIQQPPLENFFDRKLKKIRQIYLSSILDEDSRNDFDKYWILFKLNNKEDRYLSSLSGGEGQALKLCLGLALKKEIVLLDEPSQFLDNSLKKTLSDVIENLIKEKITILLIEHDLSWINSKANVIELAIIERKLQEKKSWSI
jgi:ABC-type Mn2+/Zn2+ transport system ATPase subunit